MSFEHQIDKENGSALGIVFIRFATHEEAKRCAEKEHGRKGAIGLGLSGKQGDGDEVRVVLDGEGVKLKAVLRELDERKRRDREERKRREMGLDMKGGSLINGSVHGGRTSTPSNHTPMSGQNNHRRPTLPNRPPGLPHRPVHTLPQIPNVASSPLPKSLAVSLNRDDGLSATPMAGRVRRPPPALAKSRLETWKAVPMNSYRHPDRNHASSSSTPVHTSRGRPDSRYIIDRKDRHYSPGGNNASKSRSRSRSPASRSPPRSAMSKHKSDRLQDHSEVLDLLARNGKDHAKIEGDSQLVAMVSEDDVRDFFSGFKVDQVRLYDTLFLCPLS